MTGNREDWGPAVARLVEALHHKTESGGFDSQWNHRLHPKVIEGLNFCLTFKNIKIDSKFVRVYS